MSINAANPFEVILVLVIMALAPFLTVLITSFTKVIVVFALIRTALGLQSTPPNLVLNGMAILLSIYIMFPVVSETYQLAKNADLQNVSMANIGDVFQEIKGPFERFLARNSQPSAKTFFIGTAKRLWPKEYAENVQETDFIILVPAFLTSELSAAFQIGFILYLPFVIIDLIVSNILMALGIIMIAPTIISLPFKLLLFCLVDGWTRLMEGLIMTYKL